MTVIQNHKVIFFTKKLLISIFKVTFPPKKQFNIIQINLLIPIFQMTVPKNNNVTIFKKKLLIPISQVTVPQNHKGLVINTYTRGE